MMTEADYIRKVPVLATWQAEARAQFVEGMNELNGMAIHVPKGEEFDPVGVLLLGPYGHRAHYVPRERVLELAESELGFPPEALAALREPAPGELQVLIIGPPKLRMMLGIPGTMKEVRDRGSEGN